MPTLSAIFEVEEVPCRVELQLGWTCSVLDGAETLLMLGAEVKFCADVKAVEGPEEPSVTINTKY